MYYIFLIFSVIVLIFVLLDFKKIKISIASVVSIAATNVVLLGFLVYTFIYFTGYQVYPYLKANYDKEFKYLVEDLLKSKTLFEQLTYFATLAGLYALLSTNNLKFPRKEIKTKKKNSKKLINQIDATKEDIRLKQKLLEGYERKAKE